MTSKLIGALVIGQSPRPDLVAPLKSRLPEECQLLQAGALDGLTIASLPAVCSGTYPLTTRMRDGSSVMIEESFLAEELQKALDQLEEHGVIATILLCAGTFSDLKGTRPLLKPFAVGCAMMNSLGLKKIGLIAPIKEQEVPIHRRWQAAGFQPSVWTADLFQQDEQFVQQLNVQIEVNALECIVLDYVGHPEPLVSQLRATTVIPLIDLGQLAIAALSAIL